MIRTSRRSRKAPERFTYQAKEETVQEEVEEDNENITDPVDSDYEGTKFTLAHSPHSNSYLRPRHNAADENVRKTISKKKKTKKTQKKKKRSRVVFVDQEEEEMEQENVTIPSLMTLYSEIVCTEKPDVEESVRRWMRRYEKRAMEEENGMVSDDMISSPTHELLAFVLLVTAGDVPKSLPHKVISLFETNLKQNENDVDVESLAKEFSEKINVISKYPIRAKTNVRNVVMKFWETLVLACRNEILFEENFLDTVVSWLVTCSSSTLRALRDTATVSAYAIADSLLDIMSELSKKLQVDRRRLSTEQKKSKVSSKRVNDLKVSVKLCETNHDIAKESFSSVLHGVLVRPVFSFTYTLVFYLHQSQYENIRITNNRTQVHRSDDVDHHIRADSVEYLGKWSWKSPELVLRKHQSRLARMFQDESYRVRKGTYFS